MEIDVGSNKKLRNVSSFWSADKQWTGNFFGQCLGLGNKGNGTFHGRKLGKDWLLNHASILLLTKQTHNNALGIGHSCCRHGTENHEAIGRIANTPRFLNVRKIIVARLFHVRAKALGRLRAEEILQFIHIRHFAT